MSKDNARASGKNAIKSITVGQLECFLGISDEPIERDKLSLNIELIAENYWPNFGSTVI